MPSCDDFFEAIIVDEFGDLGRKRSHEFVLPIDLFIYFNYGC